MDLGLSIEFGWYCAGRVHPFVSCLVNLSLGLVVLEKLNELIVEVDFLWNRTVDSLKASFHPLLWTSSGLKE